MPVIITARDGTEHQVFTTNDVRKERTWLIGTFGLVFLAAVWTSATQFANLRRDSIDAITAVTAADKAIGGHTEMNNRVTKLEAALPRIDGNIADIKQSLLPVTRYFTPARPR